MRRRERALEPATAAFEAAVPGRIRGEERFQQALQGAESAEALQRAIARDEGEIKEWAAKAAALLSSIKTADHAYAHQLHQAVDAYRNSITGGTPENETNGMRGD